MGRTAILTTAVVGAAAVGGYFYLSHAMEQQVRAQIEAFINSPDVEATVAYDSLRTSLLSGTAVIEGISITNDNRPDTKVGLQAASLDIGFSPFSGTATVDGFKIEGFNLNAPEANVSLDSAELQGADLPAIYASIEDKTLTEWPLTLVDIRGFKMDGAAPANPAEHIKIGLRQARIATSDDRRRVDELLIDGLEAAGGNQATLTLGRYEIRGLEIGWIRDLIAVGRAQDAGESSLGALQKTAALSLAKASMNYMGVDYFALQDVNFAFAPGGEISLKEFSAKDLVRKAGIVIGGNMTLDALEFSGMENTSPQAMQIMTLADMKTIRLDMASLTSFDDATSSATTQTRLDLDGLIKIESDGTVTGLDTEKMHRTLIEYQTAQMEEAFKAADGTVPPQEAPFAKLGQALKVYTGYYDGISMTLNVEDQGLLSRGFRVYSALSGLPEDQLREQFTMMAVVQTEPLLGEGAPENMAEVIANFMSAESAPMRISMRSLVPLDQETLTGITQQTWQEVLELKLDTVAPGGTPAGK